MQANDTHPSSNSLLACCRHAAREAEPKDYDVTDSNEKRDLLKATYCRIGSCDEVGKKEKEEEIKNRIREL